MDVYHFKNFEMAGNSEASAGYRRRDRLQSNSCQTDRCQVRERERSALFLSELRGDGSIGIWIEEGMLDRRFNIAPMMDWSEGSRFSIGWKCARRVHREIKNNLTRARSGRPVGMRTILRSLGRLET